MPEEWGGILFFVQKFLRRHTKGLNDLIESILLQAEVLDLKAAKDTLAEGIVIEAKMEESKQEALFSHYYCVTKGTLRTKTL